MHLELHKHIICFELNRYESRRLWWMAIY